MCAAVAIGGCGGGSSDASERPTTTGPSGIERTEPTIQVPDGAPPKTLVVKDLIRGEGPPIESTDELTVEYVGAFYNGQEFTNSWERSKPFEFRLNDPNAFIETSWRQGLLGMRLGGRRELLVPPANRGGPAGSVSSGGLVYIVDLIAVNP